MQFVKHYRATLLDCGSNKLEKRLEDARNFHFQSVTMLVCQSLRVWVRRSDDLSVCQSHALSVYEST